MLTGFSTALKDIVSVFFELRVLSLVLYSYNYLNIALKHPCFPNIYVRTNCNICDCNILLLD